MLWGGTIALVSVAVVGVIHCALLIYSHRVVPAGFDHYFAALSAVAASGAALATLTHSPDIEFALVVPLMWALCVAGALDVVRSTSRRRTVGQPTGMATAAPLTTATIAAASVAGLISLAPVFISAMAALTTAVRAITLDSWGKRLTDSLVTDRPEWIWSVIAVALATALAWGFSIAARAFVARAVALASVAAAGAICAVVLTGELWAIMSGWLLIATVGIAAWLVGRLRERVSTIGSEKTDSEASRAQRSTLVRNLLRVALVAGMVALGLAYAVSWASSDSWIAGTVAALAGVLIVRWGAGPASLVARTAASVVALAILFIGSWALAQWIVIDRSELLLNSSVNLSIWNGARFVSIAAVIVLFATAIISRRLMSDTERRTLYWSAGVVVAVLVPLTSIRDAAPLGALLAEPFAVLSVSAITLASLAIWAHHSFSLGLVPERATATILLVPAVFFVVNPIASLASTQFTGILPDPRDAELAPAITVALGAAASLALAITRPKLGSRLLRDLGAGGVAAIALASASSLTAPWLSLLILAVATLLIAVDRSGLFAARGARKHVGWVSLFLATSALWSLLAENETSNPEPYVLPLAGALLLIAVGVWRAGRRHTPDGRDADSMVEGRNTPPLAVSTLTFGGLLVGILPIAVVAADGPIARTIAVGLASAVLLIAASYANFSRRAPHTSSELAESAAPHGTSPALSLRHAVALAALIGVIVTATGRGLTMISEIGPPGLELDAVILASTLTIGIAGFGRFRPSIRTTLAVVALTVFTAFELPAIVDGFEYWNETLQLADLRAVGLVIALSTVFVIAHARRSAPLSRTLGIVSLSYAVIAATTGLAAGVLSPLEWATIPLSIALIAAGTVTLRRSPQVRSWQAVGAGLLLLIIPSLFFTITDRPYWRVIAIAVVAIAFVIVGQLTKLQAPFIIGTVVIVAHGLATFSPQIRAVFEAGGWFSWIVIAAVGGTILTVFAARTEKSLRTTRNAIARISHMR